MRIGIGHADVVRVGIVRTAVVRASVARATVVCVCIERLLARVQLGEPRLGGLCFGAGVRSSSSALAASVATTGWRRSSRWRGRQHTRRVRRRAGRPNPAPVCRRVRASSDSGARRSADPPASTAPWAGARPRPGRAYGHRRRSCGEAEEGMHAATACAVAVPCVPTADTALRLKFRAGERFRNN